MTFPLVILQFEFSFMETILWTNIGGIIGVYFFSFLSDRLISWWNMTFRKSKNLNPDAPVAVKSIFTKKNRRIVRIKQQYGLIGIALSTPIILSIPVGVFLVVRYYGITKKGFIYLIASNLVWSVIYSGFYLIWDGVIFNRV